MAEIEDVGPSEFYAPFIRVVGRAGTVLLFYDVDEDEDETGPPITSFHLANDLGKLLDRD